MKRIGEYLLTAVYILIAAVMFYTLQMEPSSIELGGFNIMFFYVLGGGIILLGIGTFLVRPQVPRLLLLGKYCLILVLPYLVSVFMSLIIWVVNLAQPNVMIRGGFYSVYQIIAVLVAASTLYIFGDKGILVNFVAMVISNAYIMFLTIRQGGAAEFFRQFYVLLSSGAAETGILMKRMERVGLTYSFGMFVLFWMLYKQGRKNWKDWLLIVIALFFFLVSYKRSAAIALVVALAVGVLIKWIGAGGKKAALIAGCWLLVIVGMFYIWMVKSGLWGTLTVALGINTSGRSLVFENIDPYYSFSPFFLGTGLGYITKMLQTGELFLGIYITDLHNDLLRQYVEQGFWGYLIWLISMFVWRIRMLQKRNLWLGVLALANATYCFVTYFTENNYNLYYANLTMSLLMIGYDFEAQVEKEKRAQGWLR